MPEIHDLIPGVDDAPVFRRAGPGGSLREDLVVAVLVVVVTALFMVVALVEGPFDAKEDPIEDRAETARIAAPRTADGLPFTWPGDPTASSIDT